MAEIGSYPLKETISNSDTVLVRSSNGSLVRVPFNSFLEYIKNTFLDLGDTPGTYVGEQGKVPQVNNTEDGLEFVASGLAPTFLVLPDTPSTYSGQAGKILAVNQTNNGIIFEEIEDAVPNVVYVTEPSDLAGTLDSTKSYIISDIVDMGVQQIEVPAGGLNLHGRDFNTSKLISSQAGYTMFTSPGGGSGTLLGHDFSIEVTGAGSQVYDLTAATGNEAIELSRINYNNCTSLGEIDGYRQGLESGTGRFGGTPDLVLSGTWAGGFRISTSIVRGIDNAMSAALFVEGTSFTMASRFLTDINVDLGTTAPLLDFQPSNFPNPSTLQIQGAIITRNGVSDADDSTITPNITADDLVCSWANNQGLTNTFEGGRLAISSEITTTITTPGVFEDIEGTWDTSELVHFDSPANGQLRHLGTSPRDYRVSGDLVIDGDSGDEIEIKLVKWDDSASGFVDIGSQRRQVNALIGGRDVAFFNSTAHVTLDQNDYVKLQIANNTDISDVTAELDSFLLIEER